MCLPPQITCAKDLVLYCEALRQNRQYVPANSFTYKHPALTFPDALPDELVAEPWVATPQLLLKDGSWQVDQWPDESLPYVEASVGLLGNRGEVEPLAMSFVTRCVVWPDGAVGSATPAYCTVLAGDGVGDTGLWLSMQSMPKLSARWVRTTRARGGWALGMCCMSPAAAHGPLGSHCVCCAAAGALLASWSGSTSRLPPAT